MADTYKAKDYLSKYKRLDLQIKSKKNSLDELRMRINSLSSFDYSKDKVSSSPTNAIENNICNLIMFEDEYKKDLVQLYKTKNQIESKIYSMQNQDYKTLLMLRYIDCLTFENIADEMHYSFQWIAHLHNQALIEFTELYL